MLSGQLSNSQRQTLTGTVRVYTQQARAKAKKIKKNKQANDVKEYATKIKENFRFRFRSL